MGRLSGCDSKKIKQYKLFYQHSITANSNNKPGGYLPDLIKNKHSRQIIWEPPLVGDGGGRVVREGGGQQVVHSSSSRHINPPVVVRPLFFWRAHEDPANRPRVPYNSANQAPIAILSPITLLPVSPLSLV